MAEKSKKKTTSDTEKGAEKAPAKRVVMPDRSHFGEGICEARGRLFQLTWQDRAVYRYDVNSLELLRLADAIAVQGTGAMALLTAIFIHLTGSGRGRWTPCSRPRH